MEFLKWLGVMLVYFGLWFLFYALLIYMAYDSAPY